MKERMTQLAAALNLSMRGFSMAIGMSPGWGTTMSGKGIGSDVLAKILARFPEVNPTWLITGEGEIFQLESEDVGDSMLNSENYYRKLCISLAKDNDDLRVENAKLRQDLYDAIDKYKKITMENIALMEKHSAND
jgi:hypothetical protein